LNKAEVIAWLRDNRDARGIAHWEKREDSPEDMQSVGIGLTRLRKLAKTIGRDPKLAAQLWKSDIYEARIVSLLVDDPQTLTTDQAERQVEQLQGGYLPHVFSSCDATLARAPFVIELLDKWIRSPDEMRRRCGYGLLYEVSKWKKKSAPDDETFLAYVDRIEKNYQKQSVNVLMAMGAALMGIGMRNKRLNKAAIRVAKKIGPIDFDPDGNCDPTDVEKRLKNPLVQSRLRD